MLVFVTGGSGFIGQIVVPKLIQRGHQVLGLARSDTSADLLRSFGAEVIRGELTDHSILQEASKRADAVLHLGFNHDFANFAGVCAQDLESMKAMASVLEGTGKVFIGTTGLLSLIGLTSVEQPADEDTPVAREGPNPRLAGENYVSEEMNKMGIKATLVRLSPTTHEKGHGGFLEIIRPSWLKAGYAAYPGDGNILWPGVHRRDAAELFCLAVEAAHTSSLPPILHAVAEWYSLKDLAESFSRVKGIRVKGDATPEEMQETLGWLTHFVATCPVLAEKTKKVLGWNPNHPGLIDDLEE